MVEVFVGASVKCFAVVVAGIVTVVVVGVVSVVVVGVVGPEVVVLYGGALQRADWEVNELHSDELQQAEHWPDAVDGIEVQS